MSFVETLQHLQESPIAWAISGSAVLFPWLESIHVLAITFVVGSIGMVDLRLLGWAGRGDSLARMTREIVPWTIGAFCIAAVTGALLFSSSAVRYWANGYFKAKLVLLVLAGLNMLVFHFVTGRRMADWPTDAPLPTAARVAGGLSLLFWIFIVVFGRWIGFTL